MLIITNLEGKSLPLPKVDKFERKRGTNGDYEVVLRVRKTERNKEVFNLIKTESIITLGKEKYRIKDIDVNIENNQPVVEAIAFHQLYDMSGDYQEEIIPGEKVLSLHQALTHALEPTDYTFIIEDEFDNISLEDFGDNKSLALFNELKQKFGFEFSIENKHFTIVKRLGSENNQQMRWKHNIKAIVMNDNTHNLALRIKGYGKPKEDEEGNIIEGEYEVEAEYISPHAHKYDRMITATPYYNEKITYYDTLLRYLKDILIDEPELTFEIEYEELARNIITPTKKIELGDTIHLIHELLSDIQLKMRIEQVIDYPLHPHIKPRYTISSKPIPFISDEGSYANNRTTNVRERNHK